MYKRQVPEQRVTIIPRPRLSYRADDANIHTRINSQDQGAPGGAQEGERGIGGALAGAASGGFLGSKANHGILGAIGGAIAGHFAEEKLKKHGDGHHGSGHGGSNGGNPLGSMFGGGKH